ncbi:hypothetical protein GQ54DRAFT_263466 [Martensiomyces pterosporus]|nr:hypothetical protein GQ54DRAFT_263466 [Martensiomyces pterosporus]
MHENDLDKIRQQYLRRAISIIVRSSDYDAATAYSLDILCDVGILYMQSVFSQVHAYAEHATRTRPNMNDVGRALEQRHVSASQLDAYYQSEMEARTQPQILTAVDDLQKQAARLSATEAAASAQQNSESGVFFANSAETLLRKLVDHHKSTAAAQRSRERQTHAAVANHSSVNMRTSSAAGSSTRANRHSAGEIGGNINGDNDDDGNDDDDDEAEEDADFEAPEASFLHLQPSAPADSNTSIASERRLQPSKNEGQEQQQQQHSVAADRDSAAVDALQPEHAADTAIAEQDDELERVLLPPPTLPEYIPAQCPLFPSPHTYKQTPVFPKREQDLFRTRIHKAEQSRQAEENLQRLISGAHINPCLPGSADSISPPSPAERADCTAGAEAKAAEQKETAAASVGGKHSSARQRIQSLFPPANFRNAHKRARLTSFIK